MGPCAKRRVLCTIQTPGGIRITGSNDCLNPQPVCPRGPGEGYEKCTTICKQVGHAEAVALNRAGRLAKGATAILIGHDYYCPDCQQQLFDAGVVALRRVS